MNSSISNYWLKKGLSIRVANALANDGIRDLDDLKRATPKQLLSIPNFGRGSLHELQRVTGLPKPIVVDPAIRNAAEEFACELLYGLGEPQDEDRVSRMADILISLVRIRGWIKES